MARRCQLRVIARRCQLRVIARRCQLRGIARRCQLRGIARRCQLRGILAAHLFTALDHNIDACIHEGLEGQLRTDPQLSCAELLAVVGLRFVECLNLSKLIQFAVIADERIIIQHIQRIGAVMHATVADLCGRLFEHSVLCVLLSATYQTGAEALITLAIVFHDDILLKCVDWGTGQASRCSLCQRCP